MTFRFSDPPPVAGEQLIVLAARDGGFPPKPPLTLHVSTDYTQSEGVGSLVRAMEHDKTLTSVVRLAFGLTIADLRTVAELMLAYENGEEYDEEI